MQDEELQAWFANVRTVLEAAYLANNEPWKQSGMSGPAERWTALRKPVADCIDRSGSFLDIGCANGYLLECCLDWTAARAIHVEPYGVDLSPQLISLARQRLASYADHFFVANAFEWTPPRRFDFVRTELVYVPGEYERIYVEHLRDNYLTAQGHLLIANYAEGDPNPSRGLLPGAHPTRDLAERLAELEIQPIGYRYGYDPVKQRRTAVAIVGADNSGALPAA